jgi:hypothetical protein
MIDTKEHSLPYSLPDMRPTIKRAENIRSTVVIIQMGTLNHIFASCWKRVIDMRWTVGNFNLRTGSAIQASWLGKKGLLARLEMAQPRRMSGGELDSCQLCEARYNQKEGVLLETRLLLVVKL